MKKLWTDRAWDDYKSVVILPRLKGATQMQTQAYEGYFERGKFHTAGKPLRIPEHKRVLIAILGDMQSDVKKHTAWNDFKHMVKDTACENALLDDDAFLRRDGGRKLIDFVNGV